jgi:hypothetical protein
MFLRQTSTAGEHKVMHPKDKVNFHYFRMIWDSAAGGKGDQINMHAESPADSTHKLCFHDKQNSKENSEMVKFWCHFRSIYQQWERESIADLVNSRTKPPMNGGIPDSRAR